MAKTNLVMQYTTTTKNIAFDEGKRIEYSSIMIVTSHSVRST